MKKTTILFTLFLALTMLFAACTNDNTGQTPSPTKPPSPAPTKTATPTPPPTEIPTTEPTEDEPYDTDILKGDGYTMSIYPGWSQQGLSGIGILYAPDMNATVNIITEDLPYGMTPEEYYLAGKDILGLLYQNVNDIEHRSTTVGPYNAYLYTYSVGIQNLTVTIEQYYIVENDTAYVITYSDNSDADYSGDFNAMLNTFQVLAR